MAWGVAGQEGAEKRKDGQEGNIIGIVKVFIIININVHISWEIFCSISAQTNKYYKKIQYTRAQSRCACN